MKKSNVTLKENFTQVVICPGTALGNDTGEDFEKFMLEHCNVRVQYLENIVTAPDVCKHGHFKLGTGGRSDLFFAIHSEDISKFAIAHKLQLGMRWIEDATSKSNGYHENSIYPDRVLKYCSWDGEVTDELKEKMIELKNQCKLDEFGRVKNANDTVK